MKQLTHLLIVLAAMASAGCRSDVHRELLERELRWQEDEIDQMESHVIECKRRLASLQRENAALREKLAAAQARLEAQQQDDAGMRPSTRKGRRPAAEDGTPPQVELDEETAPFRGPPQRAAPGAEIPEGEPAELPADDSGELPALEPLPNDNQTHRRPEADPALAGRSAGSSGRRGPTTPSGSKPSSASAVHRIVLDRHTTHGYDADGQPGDDGIRVVIQPRDRQDRIVHVPGELHIELYAPTSEGEIPVARWVFTAEQTAQRLAATPDGQGMAFTLRWPAHPPPQRQVKLYVRYHSEDGAELTAEQALVVNLAAASARRPLPPQTRPSSRTSPPQPPVRTATPGSRPPRRTP